MGFKKIEKEEAFIDGARGEAPAKKAGRPLGGKKNIKKKNVTVQLSEEEYLRLKNYSANSGMSMATYIKHNVLYKD